MLTYLQAVVIGVLQGVTELFPVSSLGHSVLVPAVIGGSWKHLVTESASGDSSSSPYLAFIVALHVATACALLVLFRADWIRIIRGFLRSVGPSFRERRMVADDPDSRLAWLIIIATIPVGLTGLLFEHSFRTLFAKPLAAAIFLFVNGLILLAGERLRRRAEPSLERPREPATGEESGTRPVLSLSAKEATVIGSFQILALFAGISRSGAAMVGGLLRGLSHEDAVTFSFLLATPVIFAAGVWKLPSLAGHAGDNIHGQLLVGFVVAGLSAYAAARFLVRYFQTRTLTPFAIYSLVAGAFCIVRFSV